MFLDEIVFCESSSRMSAHTVHCLTFLHVDVDMNATLGVVQYTTYPTVHNGHDYSIYTFLETVEQNLRKPIYSVLILLSRSKWLQGLSRSKWSAGTSQFPRGQSSIDWPPTEGKEQEDYIIVTSGGKVRRWKNPSPPNPWSLSVF